MPLFRKEYIWYNLKSMDWYFMLWFGMYRFSMGCKLHWQKHFIWAECKSNKDQERLSFCAKFNAYQEECAIIIFLKLQTPSNALYLWTWNTHLMMGLEFKVDWIDPYFNLTNSWALWGRGGGSISINFNLSSNWDSIFLIVALLGGEGGTRLDRRNSQVGTTPG